MTQDPKRDPDMQNLIDVAAGDPTIAFVSVEDNPSLAVRRIIWRVFVDPEWDLFDMFLTDSLIADHALHGDFLRVIKEFARNEKSDGAMGLDYSNGG